MIGNPAQERARWDIGEMLDPGASSATFLGQLVAKELHRRIFDTAREIEQDRIRAEI